MKVEATVRVEDPAGIFAQSVTTEFESPIKNTKVDLSFEGGWSRMELRSPDVTSARAAMSAIMNAVKVVNDMQEGNSYGSKSRD